MLVPYVHQDETFLKRHFTAFDGKKVTQELLPYTGENLRAPTCLHGKVTDRGYL